MSKLLKPKVVKSTAFIIIFFILFFCASSILTGSGGANYQMMATFPEEPAGSLDAIYVGGSNAFTFFQGPIAWKKYGMTVRMFSADGMPMACREDFIRYARRSHPDALYIIVASPYYTSFTKEGMHWCADFFPESRERYQMIRKMTSLSQWTLGQSLAIYFPIIQYHSRWNALWKGDFHHESDGVKGSFYSSTFLNVAEDVSESYSSTDRRAELDEGTLAYYDEFLDYCDEVNLNALFVIPPTCPGEEAIAADNSIQELLESRGYPVLNFMTKFDELGLDLKVDYYNAGHTNVHGSLKFTDYLAEYISENYSFSDKRGDPDYTSWDEAYEKYRGIIAPVLSEEELAGLP